MLIFLRELILDFCYLSFDKFELLLKHAVLGLLGTLFQLSTANQILLRLVGFFEILLQFFSLHCQQLTMTKQIYHLQLLTFVLLH